MRKLIEQMILHSRNFIFLSTEILFDGISLTKANNKKWNVEQSEMQCTAMHISVTNFLLQTYFQR